MRIPTPGSPTLATLLIAAAAAAGVVLGGCGSGSAAIAAGTGGSGTSSVKPAQIESIAVRNVKGPTADVDFVLGGQQSSSRVRIGWFRPGSQPQLVTTMTKKPKSQAHTLANWNFFKDLGLKHGALAQNVTVFAVLDKDYSPQKGPLQQKLNVNNSVTIALGNEAPRVTMSNVQFMGKEFAGVLPFTFSVADSSDEGVDVTVWFRSEQIPAWTKARAFGATPGNPGNPLTLVALDQGTPVTFAWVTDSDLFQQDQRVQLLVTAEETLPVECPPPRGEALSAEFLVDNNAVPTAAIDFLGVFVNPDLRRGIPFPIDLKDDIDAVEVVFQWRFNDGAFPDLSGFTTCDLKRILQDPRARRRLQIASERPSAHEGRLVAIGATNQARLPELGTTASDLRSKYGDPAASMVGRRLEVLRPSRALVEVSQAWTPAVLQRPVAAQAAGSGASVLVLEELGPTAWQLREVRTADGLGGGVYAEPPECLRPPELVPRPPTPTKACPPQPLTMSSGRRLAGPESQSALTSSEFKVGLTNDGRPTAIALTPDGGSTLVGSVTPSGDWRIRRVDLYQRNVELLVERPLSLPAGELRGLACGESGRILGTVGSFLVRVDLPTVDLPDPSGAPVALPSGPESAAAAACTLIQFAEPWGVAIDPADPGRAYVADRGADAVFAVDLNTLVATPVAANGLALRRPTAIAVDVKLNRLLVLTQEGAGGTHELRAVSLGRAGGLVTELAAGIAPSAGGLTTGADSFAAFVVRDQSALWAGGGVEQVRTVTGYDPATHTVTVDAAFMPPLTSSVFAGKPRRWRIRDLIGPFDTKEGRRGMFVWDSADTGRSADEEAKEVLLRAFALDSDAGPVGAEVPTDVTAAQKTDVIGPLDLPPTAAVGRRAFADLDGDGDIDIVGSDGGNLQVQRQMSPGRFQPGTTLFGVSLLSLAVDVNGDGLTDLVSRNEVWRQDPFNLGQFTGPFPFAQLGSTAAVAAGDLNGDRRVDLVAIQQGSGLVVYHQGVTGNFTKDPLTLIPEFFPVQVEIADMDGDCRPDILYGGLDTVAPFGKWRDILVYLQRPDGAFKAVPDRQLVPLDTPEFTRFAVGDMRRDGIADVVAVTIANIAGASVKGSTAQYFADPATTGTGIPSLHGSFNTTPDPTDVVLADVDVDGSLDLVVGYADVQGGEPGIVVYYQNQAGFPTFPSETVAEESVRDLFATDVDGDGRLDLVADDGATVNVHLREKAGRWLLGVEDPLGFAPPGYAPPAVADFDADGDLDLACQVVGLRAIEVFFQSRPGGFSSIPIQLINADRGQQLVPADVNGDGFVDLVALTIPGSIPNNPTPIQMRLWHGPFGSGSTGVPFEDVTDLPQGVAATSDALRVGDLDGDGVPELCVRVPSGGGALAPGIVVYRRATPGAPYTKGPLLGATGGGFALVDHDPVNGADGDLDVLELAGGHLVLHEQTAPLVFAPPVALIASSAASIEVAADLDRDGVPDALLHDPAVGSSQVVYGAIGAAWQAGQTIGPDPLQALGRGTAADIDGDGFADLVLLRGGGNAVFLRVGPRAYAPDAKSVSPLTPGLPGLDIDGDGDLDVVLPAGTAVELHWGGR